MFIFSHENQNLISEQKAVAGPHLPTGQFSFRHYYCQSLIKFNRKNELSCPHRLRTTPTLAGRDIRHPDQDPVSNHGGAKGIW